MTEAYQVEHNPARGRASRADEVAGHRRRRKAGTLDRMAQFRLDCIDPSDLDLENYVYRWVSEENNGLKRATHFDDYDLVKASELGRGFDIDATNSEGGDTVRILMGKDGHGNANYGYLCKKRRDFWNADNEAAVEAREAMMEGRIYGGATDGDPTGNETSDPTRYIPGNPQIGHGGERRRGRVAK